MKFFDNIKEDYQKVKDLPSKEKWGFFWDYYKVPVICIVLAVVLLVQGILAVVNRKEVAFSGVLLNCKISIEEDDFLKGFYEASDIDSKTQMAAFYSDMLIVPGQNTLNTNTIQRIVAGISVRDTDFITGDDYSFQVCAYHSGRIFMDLREFLDAETLEKYADCLYYIDDTIIDQINAPLGEQVEPDTLAYPTDPKNPETMKKPIPVGIDISKMKAFHDTYYLPDTKAYIGIVRSSPRPELVRQFLAYILA